MNEGVVWKEQTIQDGEVTVRVGYTRDGALVVDWPGEATLTERGGIWRFDPAPGTSPERAEKLARGPARAVQRYLRGEMSLHASAVVIEGRALVFLGPSGAGKSTAAAILCQRSGRLLADDILAVDWVNDALIALPTESTHWLDSPDHEMKRPRAASGATEPAPVHAIVVLSVNEAATSTQPKPVRGRPAMLALSTAHLTLPTATRGDRMRDFEWIATVGTRVPMFELTRRCEGDPNEVASSALRLLAHP